MDLLTLESLPVELQNAIVHRDLAAGETLFQQGDSALSFFVVETGRVKLLGYTSGDKEVTLQIAESGDGVAEIALFSETYSCTAVAQMNSRVIIYPKKFLLSAIRNNPDLAEHFMTMLVRKIQDLKIRVELRDIRAAHERLLRYLHYQAQSGEQTVVNFDRPLKDIAADLSLTPETLSRALTRLERDGMITRTRLQITLQNSPAA